MPQEIARLASEIRWEPIDTDDDTTEKLYHSSYSDLAAIEAFMGTSLPEDYKWFMTHVGRRILSDSQVNIRINGVWMEFLDWFRDAVDVLTFTQIACSVDDDGDSKIPSNLLVITNSISHDKLLMDLTKDNYGKIWYLSCGIGEKDWRNHKYEGMVLIANSFTDLLKQIINNDSMQ